MALSALNKVFSSTSAKHIPATTFIITYREDKMVKNIIENLQLKANKAVRPAILAALADRHFDLVIHCTDRGTTLKLKNIDNPASVKAAEALAHKLQVQQRVHKENLARIRAASWLRYATSAGVVAIALGTYPGLLTWESPSQSLRLSRK